ncbi:hypothetical protein CXF95_06105 [Paraglaciecola sp. MB-3u-78]|nr:hypothetical protein CXF95_06105 [Paraglaciecola sp. MB-3u-78]
MIETRSCLCTKSLHLRGKFALLDETLMNWRQHWIKNEQARKRWIADISHELRTPVAVLKGKIVAMLDGVRALSIERIQSANEEVKELEQLLDNLYELTRTDLGTMHYSKGRLNLFHYSIMKPSGIIRC